MFVFRLLHLVAEGSFKEVRSRKIMWEKTETEVYQMLGQVEYYALISICQMLDLDSELFESKTGNKRQLLKVIMRYLSSEELEETKDKGLSVFLELHTMLSKHFERPRPLTPKKRYDLLGTSSTRNRVGR